MASALGVAAPLLVGALTGHAADGAMVALGAYLVALTAPSGPYGARARSLAVTAAVVAVGAAAGGLLIGHPWAAAAIVPEVVATGAALPWIGPSGGLSMLLTAIRPPAGSLFYTGFLELLGAAWVSLLLLLPWPARRLRPMREALSEAAEAVAATLDAVAEKVGVADPSPLDQVELTDPGLAAVTRAADWERRRRAAADALGAARTTYSLYRSDRAPDDQPERLINALSRIQHETVALQAHLAALERSPVRRRSWELDVRVAIAALAARVRLLAGAMATRTHTPLGDPDSAAVRRLARQSDRIWRAAHESEAELVDAALVSQVRRTIDRIAGTIDFARNLMASGLRIGILPPWRHPAAPAEDERRSALRDLWDRALNAVRTRSPMFRHVTRVWLLVAISLVISAAFTLPHGHWLTITVMLGLRGTYGETVERVAQQVAGTAVGAAIAAVLLTLTPSRVSAAVLLFCCALAAFTLRPLNQIYWAVFGTPLVMMLLDFSTPADWTAAGERIGLTVGGGLLALAGARLLWPAGGAQILPDRLARLLSVQADLARAAAEVLDGERDGLPRELLNDTLRATADVADVRTRLTREPLPDTALIERLQATTRSAYRVRDDLIALTRRTGTADAGPAAGIVERVADRLAEAATGADGSRPLDLTAQFEELDEHLSTLVRRRQTEEPEVTETTPLRQAILAAAGLRHALRALARDAEKLAGAAPEPPSGTG